MEGIILKALSGFYYVDGGDGVLVACRGRGKFRHQRITPLVGDKVIFTPLDNGAGILDEILPRRNEFQRPENMTSTLWQVTKTITNILKN